MSLPSIHEKIRPSICLLVLLIDCVISSGQYTVVAPGTIHSGHPYSVTVAVFNIDEPQYKFKITISGSEFRVSRYVTLERYDSMEQIDFQLPKLRRDDYYLSVRGLSGLKFYNETKLIYKEFQPYIRIQMAKLKYRPGELFKFRVLFLDENINPTLPHVNVMIWCEDAHGNRIKEFTNVYAQIKNGIFIEKIYLVEYAVLGEWRLCVQNSLKIDDKCRYFEVADHTNPRFSVYIVAPNAFALTADEASFEVHAQYMYGGGVEGNVTVVLKEFSEEPKLQNVRNKPITIETDITNGKLLLRFDLKRYRMPVTVLTPKTHLKIYVTVWEKHTEQHQNATKDIVLYPYRYLANCIGRACHKLYTSQFENVQKVVQYKITHLNDTPVLSVNLAKLFYTPAAIRSNPRAAEAPPMLPKKVYQFSSNINFKGIASFKINLPFLESTKSYMVYYKTELEFNGERQQLFNSIFKLQSRSKAMAKNWQQRVNLESESVERSPVNAEVMFNFKLENTMWRPIFTIVGRGNIQLSGNALSKTSNSIRIRLATTPQMAPMAKVFLYTVNETAHLVSDEFAFLVDIEMKNYLEITAPTNVKPGSKVDFLISTRPGSFVCILAVDRAAKVHNSVNDITMSDIVWFLGLYKTTTPWQGGFSQYPGQRSGLLILTNANFEYNRKSEHFDLNIQQRSAKRYATRRNSERQPNNQPYYQNRYRSNFGDIWFFYEIKDVKNITTIWSKQIPSDITAWDIKAFSMHPKYGLGLMKKPLSIVSEKLFFIKVLLPNTMKRGEIVEIPVTVFNNLPKSLEVIVKLENNNGQFDVLSSSNYSRFNQNDIKKLVSVQSYDSKTTTFLIVPRNIGGLNLKFDVYAENEVDRVLHRLRVTAEGLLEQKNKDFFINLDNKQHEENYSLDFPDNLISGSEQIELTVFGHLLGPLLIGLNNLAQVPSGTSEQIATKLISNYLVFEYLNNTNKLKPAWRQKILRHLENGYQSLFRYRLNDGSFSYFKAVENSRGSTWLTAYVLRSLQAISKVFPVRKQILRAGYKFLMSKQNQNGTFFENGETNYRRKDISDLELTAHVMLTLIGNREISESKQLKKSFEYIKEQAMKQRAPIKERAMTKYVMARSGNEALILSEEVLNEEETALDSHIFTKNSIFDNEGGMANAGQTAAYKLLTTLSQVSNEPPNQLNSALPLLKWLIGHHNSLSGDAATHETVAGLVALFEFAKKVNYRSSTAKITVYCYDGKDDQFKQLSKEITEENALELQTLKLPPNTRRIRFTIDGSGSILVQLVHRYNVVIKENNTTNLESFKVDTKLSTALLPYKLQLEVCIQGVNDKISDLAVADIFLPTGYVTYKRTLGDLSHVNGIKRVVTKNSDTIISIFISTNTQKDHRICLQINAFRLNTVTMQQPTPIVVYDFYNSSLKTIYFYTISSNLCNICEQSSCKEICQSIKII